MVSVGLIILGLVLLIIVIVVVLIILTKMKGKITINLDKFDFSPGETITGALILKLKKPVEATALNVGLIGTRETSSYNRKSNERNDSSNTIYNFKKPVDGEKQYLPGEKTYQFQLLVPTDINKYSTGNQVADTLIKSAQLLSGTTSRIEWYVTANLEMKGFDISKKVRVNIS